MKFGLFIPQGWRYDLVGIDAVDQWRVMSQLARRADEARLWDSLWVYDHFHTSPKPSGEATHEAWSLTSALAAVTSRVRLGQMCTCISYRNPAYLAKVAATVDVISGGRLEMAVGAGWYEHEWRAYGYGFPPAGERIARLREGVQILRQMWTEGAATFDGEHYRVDGALGAPRPLQARPRSGIPLWVAGGGERKTLRIAAEYADYANFDGTPEVFVHKSDVLARHCRDVGRDPHEIVRTANYNPVVGRTQREVDDRLAWYAAHLRPLRKAGLDPERAVADLRGQPLVGTVEQVVERLRGLERAGMDYAICYFIDAAYDRRSLELFEREVMPHLMTRG